MSSSNNALPQPNKTVAYSQLTCLYLNARSARNKSLSIHAYILAHNPDIVLITESWFKPDDNIPLRLLIPQKYSYVKHDRLNKPGGGLLILYKRCLTSTSTPVFCIPTTTSFESIYFYIAKTHFLLLYRPPLLSVTQFLDEFMELVLREKFSNCIFIGDFNLPGTNLGTINSDFISLLESCNLHQLVNSITHNRGNILDLVISPPYLKDSTSVTVHDWVSWTDHAPLTITVSINHLVINQPKLDSVLRRDWNMLNNVDFKKAFSKSFLPPDISTNPSAVNTATDAFYATLSNLASDVPSITLKVSTSNSKHPWYNSSIRRQIRIVRKIERASKYISNKRIAYAKEKVKLLDLLDKAVLRYFSSSKAISSFRLLNSFHSSTSTSLSSESFASTFRSKVLNIRNKFVPTSCSTAPNIHIPYKLSAFSNISSSLLIQLLHNVKLTFCTTDIIPSQFLLHNIDFILPAVLQIINSSLSLSLVPSYFKHSTTIPILKDHNLDVDNPINYRPISLLPFLSKVLERIVFQQIYEHISRYNLLDSRQCAYRPGHSTEIALLTVQDHIWRATENGLASALVLTDLSSAFDTVDHNILITRLQNCFGINGAALKWMQSYLEDRTFSVLYKTVSSVTYRVDCGVPQGSVLGPLLFSCYISPMGNILSKIDNIKHLFYADDLQVVVTGTSVADCQHNVTSCVHEIRSWLTSNGLAFNDSKTKLLCFSPAAKSSFLSTTFSFTVGSSLCSSDSSVRDLGVILDDTLSMDKQITNLTKTCFSKLKNLWRIRRYVSFETAKSLVHAHVISRLDYCNSLLLKCNTTQIASLQRIQNCAARFVFSRTDKCSTTEMLIKLHWLPVKKRLLFKIATVIHNTLYSENSTFMRELIKIQSSVSSRRTADRLIPQLFHARIGGKAFSNYAPILWNNLPERIRSLKEHNSFRIQLKTYLFST